MSQKVHVGFWNPPNDFEMKATEAIIDQPEMKRRREERIEPRNLVHPLLIDHVVEKILSYSEIFTESVKQFRLVCKHWSGIATKEFRTTNGKICFENDFNRKTAKFIRVMKKSTNLPFDKFKFCGGFVVYKPYNGQYEYDQIFNELFKICVPSMKSLEFTSHNPSDLKFPKNLKVFDLSNLESLAFHVCVYYEPLQSNMTAFLETLFKAAPNLTKIDFKITTTDPSMRNNDQLELINKFGDLIATKLPRKCKHLKLNMLITEEQLDKFGQQGLELESLIVDFQKGPLSTHTFENFLKNQAETLQYLELIESPLEMSMEFPVLENLNHMRIEGKPVIPSFKFDKVFPKMKNLEILFYWIYQEDNWLKDVFVDNGFSKSVLEVDFMCEITDSDVSALYRMAKCFPKMKRLSVVVNSLSALTTIFSTMTFLEELEMSLAREFWKWQGRGDVDEAFTGLPAHQCVFLLKENDFSLTDLPSTLRKPSLRNLKQLKRLKIRAFHPEKIPLTDVTVHFALLKMDSLEELTLDVFPVSNQCLRTLEKKIQLKLLPGPPTLP